MREVKLNIKKENEFDELIEELETKEEFYSCGVNACGYNS